MTKDKFDRFISLIKAAQEATEQNKLQWKMTAEENRFQAALPQFSLMILRESGRTTSSHILWGEESPRFEYFVEIRGDDGELIDEISVRDLGSAGKQYMLADLFSLARRSATGSYSVIDDIVKSLNDLSDAPS